MDGPAPFRKYPARNGSLRLRASRRFLPITTLVCFALIVAATGRECFSGQTDVQGGPQLGRVESSSPAAEEIHKPEGSGFGDSSPAEVQDPGPLCRSSVWLVCTRNLPCDGSSSDCLEGLVVHRLQDAGWRRSDLDELVADQTPTTVYVHGNRYESTDAIEVGTTWSRLLVSGGCCDGIRFVIWSWPSAPECGPVRDLRTMAYRSELQGRYLAEFVDLLPDASPVSLIGHSYGSRLISSTLHLLGGGTIDHVMQEAPCPECERSVRAILMAAAVDCDWLLPGRRHGSALLAAERVVVLKNDRDPILKRYHLLYPCNDPQALGYAGLPRSILCGPYGCQVAECDVSDFVGARHSWVNFARSTRIVELIRREIRSLTMRKRALARDSGQPKRASRGSKRKPINDSPSVEPTAGFGAGTAD